MCRKGNVKNKCSQFKRDWGKLLNKEDCCDKSAPGVGEDGICYFCGHNSVSEIGWIGNQKFPLCEGCWHSLFRDNLAAGLSENMPNEATP